MMTVPSMEELDSFKYSDLKNLAKSLGLQANLRTGKLLKALKAHLKWKQEKKVRIRMKLKLLHSLVMRLGPRAGKEGNSWPCHQKEEEAQESPWEPGLSARSFWDENR
jgi:hypothetical protein